MLVMRRRWIILSLLTAASVVQPVGAESPSSIAKRWASEELHSDLAELAGIRADLRRSVGLAVEPVGDHIAVTVFGGLPPPLRETFTASMTPKGRWAIERVTQIFDFAANKTAAPRLDRYLLDDAASDRLSQLVRKPPLYREVHSAKGTCTDSPTIVIEISLDRRRRDAVRAACPADDLTEQIIEAVISSEPKP